MSAAVAVAMAGVHRSVNATVAADADHAASPTTHGDQASGVAGQCQPPWDAMSSSAAKGPQVPGV